MSKIESSKLMRLEFPRSFNLESGINRKSLKTMKLFGNISETKSNNSKIILDTALGWDIVKP